MLFVVRTVRRSHSTEYTNVPVGTQKSAGTVQQQQLIEAIECGNNERRKIYRKKGKEKLTDREIEKGRQRMKQDEKKRKDIEFGPSKTPNIYERAFNQQTSDTVAYRME